MLNGNNLMLKSTQLNIKTLYGMAISNGGGYVLSLLILRTARNQSREEVEAAAIARSGSPVRRYSSSDFDGKE